MNDPTIPEVIRLYCEGVAGAAHVRQDLQVVLIHDESGWGTTVDQAWLERDEAGRELGYYFEFRCRLCSLSVEASTASPTQVQRWNTELDLVAAHYAGQVPAWVPLFVLAHAFGSH